MKTLKTIMAVAALFLCSAMASAQTFEVTESVQGDLASLFVNAGFDEDLSFTTDGKYKEGTVLNAENSSLSGRSWLYTHPDGSCYAHAKTRDEGNSKWNGKNGRTWATNGFVAKIKGWVCTRTDSSTCEFVYAGILPYGMESKALPVADDGNRYQVVPSIPDFASNDDNIGALFCRVGWGEQCSYKQNITLPSGSYRLEYWTINTNSESTSNELIDLTNIKCGNNVFTDMSGAGLSSTEWTRHYIDFNLNSTSTECVIELGFQAPNKSSNDLPQVFVDGLCLYEAVKVNGIKYHLDNLTKTASVAGADDTPEVVIPEIVADKGEHYNVTSIGSSAFEGCTGLTSVTIPNSVTSIGSSAFNGSSILVVTMESETPASLGADAFYNVKSILVPVTAYDSYVSAWSNYASRIKCPFEEDGIYYEVTSFANKTVKVVAGENKYTGDVVIPASVTYDGVELAVTSIGSSAFEGCTGLTSVTIPNSVTNIGDNVFENCSCLTKVNINCERVGSWFNGNTSIKEVILGNSVKSIGNYAFSGCSGLTSVTIPSSVTSIGSYAFKGCSGLTSVTIGDSVTSIGSYAFEGCSGLTSVTIPNSVTSIGDMAFYNCYLVVIMKSEIPASLGGKVFASAFDSFAKQIIVPFVAFDAYRSAWSNYASKIKIPFEEDGIYYEVTSSANKTVKVVAGENKYTGEVVIPASVTYDGVELAVTSIGSSAFRNCSGLTSVTIPNSVTSIGYYAFEGCSKLVVTMESETPASIESNSFSYVKSILVPVAAYDSYVSAWSGYASKIKIPFEEDGIYYEVTSSANKTVKVVAGENKYTGDVVIPASVTYEGVELAVTSIGSSAFYQCSGLTSVTIPNSVTSIGESAFYNCSGLTSVTIPNSVTSIGSSAFYQCSGLKEIAIPNSVTSIGSNAFSGCSGLSEMIIPSSVTSIGGSAFSSARLVEMKSEVAPECTSNPVSAYALVVIPDGAYDSYSQAEYWKDYANKIVEKSDAVKTVTIEAADAESSLHKAIGEENLAKVVDLTINGSINSYDFMVMRNKMTLLRKVDMSNAKIVYNAYEHYTGYHTENDQFPSYAFDGCNLVSINLPKDITRIGANALSSNGLTEVVVPDGVTSIGSSAFNGCSVLTSVTIPNSVASIAYWAFRNCSKLSSIKLPPSLKTIGSSAFSNCDALTEIRIPASVRTLENDAFHSCSNLKSVYVYTVEPISISQNTFDFGTSQVLYAPKVSYTTYWYNTQWSQFKEIREFDEPYENFYLNGDKELDNSTGAIEGEGDNNPDAEMGSGSGLIVGGDVNQDLGDVEIENGGSIIVDGTGCVNADKLHFHINVTGGKWYFFCFPFDIKAEDIKCENGSDYVFRYYDGEERAKNGKGGWKNVTSDGSGNFIKAGRGYIFQSSANDVLCITAKNGKIKKEDKYNELVEFITQNVHDASWNFVGNPYLSYYEVTNEDYNAPITIWNGSGYEAIRPGDDDYHLAPFEAFFVQKPNGEDQVNYDNDRQMTKKQSDKKKAEKAAEARMRGGVRMLDNGRKMVNITLSDGTATDRTRVVFNESVSMDYEMECDAAKFASAGIPQLYTLDSKQVKYAINERPVAEGMVAVGYSVENQGVYTIAAQRMDTQMVLKDNLTGKIHDFATDGDYTFMTEAGTFDARFALMLKGGEVTGIEGVEGGMKVEAVDGGVAVSGSGNTLVNVYNAGGAVVASQNGDGTINLPAGTYIVSAGEKNVKVTLK